MNTLTFFSRWTVILAVVLLIGSCRKNIEVHKIDPPPFNDYFAKYISAYTTGLVERNGTVKIRFATNVVADALVGKESSSSVFKFDPEIKGNSFWVDRRTVEFRPSEYFETGKVYDGVLDLEKVYDTISGEYTSFPFQIHTAKQTFKVEPGMLIPVISGKKGWYKYSGKVLTGSYEYGNKVQQTLKVLKDGKEIPIRWSHDSLGLNHEFFIDSLARTVNPYSVVLKWDASILNCQVSGDHKMDIPSLKDFRVIDAKTFFEPEQYMLLQFSDPLDQGQDVNGLIHSDKSTFNFIIENNVIKAYPSSRLTGNVSIVVEPGLKNQFGFKSVLRDTLLLSFDDVPPQIRAVNNGVIVPKTDGIPFTFEAINLNAVDVCITRIFENNMLEFLQFNDLEGDSYLEYVGKEIYMDKVLLNHDPSMNLSKWNKHTLDLSKLISEEPGAMYRVEIRFRKDYSLYQCPAEEEVKTEQEYVLEEGTPSLWDYYDRYYYYYESDESPCQHRYFRWNRGIASNILASDLGMIAKGGTDGKLMIAVTDLKTTDPLKNVEVALYDFQNQCIAASTTNENGFAYFQTKESYYVAVAKKESQRGYLKLKYGLDLSRFEVYGNTYEKGLKGFLYGERGVWRPGDSIYLGFILEDKMRVLPPDHPVVFELYNPRGQRIEKVVKKESMNGFYTFTTRTDLNAPTGTYLATAKVGGSVFEKRLKVETIIPNRLKLEFDFEKDKFTSLDKKLGDLKVRWLHGAPAGNLKADIDVRLTQGANAFPAFKGFSFDDPMYNYTSESRKIFEGTLNEEGKAEVLNTINLAQGVPGVLNATLFCRIYEPGGNFSTDHFSTVIYPYKEYVGIRPPQGDGDIGVLFTGKTHSFEIVSLDDQGKYVDKEVTLQFYKLEWRWWWEYYDDLSSYNGKFFNNPLKEEKIIMKNGKATWSTSIDEEEYGRYFIRVSLKDGHSSGKIVYFDQPGWYSRRPENYQGTSSLNFSSSKTKYKVGEQAVLEIPSSISGRALVTIEKGGKVVKADWIRSEKEKMNYSFTVTPEMAPNVYAYVTLIQSHISSNNNMAVRQYGVIPIEVDNPASHITPVIAMADVIRPEEKVNVTIKEKSGQKMTYTIAMVDEGLLDLTKFKTPDPWPQFYGKEALEVKTWDLYEYVMKRHKTAKKMLSIGGDGDGGEPGQGSKVQRFKPMVKFIGPFYLDPSASNTHTIHMPNYVGSVRVMVIAGEDGAYGSAEKTVSVKKPLMILPTLPRVLSPGELVTLPVTVFADENIRNVTVEVKLNSLLKGEEVLRKTITFSKAGEQVVNFALKVNEEVGVGRVEVTAISGKEKAWNETELEVRAPNPYTTRKKESLIGPGESGKVGYKTFGIKGTNKAVLELSTLPVLDLEKRLDYLIQYPHGCIEQTTSSVFPQVALNDLMLLNEAKKKEIEHNVKAGIRRLRLFQTIEGGMTYWPGEYGEESEWGTNYAGHFLIEASARGYMVPREMMDKWKEFQRKKANTWNQQDVYNSDLIQAYRLYLLALMKSPEYGAMNRMKENTKVSEAAKWYLAGAYYLAGQKSIAAAVSKGLSYSIPDYRELGYTYGSSVRDEAIVLEVLSVMNRRDEAMKLLNEISQTLRSEQWLSTQETAYSLVAASRFAGIASGTMKAQYRINGGQWINIETGKKMLSIPVDTRSLAEGTIEVNNNGLGQLFVNMVTKGIPMVGNEITYSKGVKVEVNYTNRLGQPVNVGELEQGTDIIAEIIVDNLQDDRALEELALTFMVPSGWEIHNPRMNGDQFSLQTSTPEYMDIRDDRVYYYFDMNNFQEDYYDRYVPTEEMSQQNNNRKIFRLALNASYVGKYYLPSVYVEAMYDKGISSSVGGKWVNVISRNQKGL